MNTPIHTGSEVFYVSEQHAEDVEASAGNDETGQGFFDDVCLNWRAYEEQIARSLADIRSVPLAITEPQTEAVFDGGRPAD